MDLITKRLTIREITYEQTNGIRDKNNNSGSVNDLFASLSRETLLLACSEAGAISDLISRLEGSMETEGKIHYGAWRDTELIGYISMIDPRSKAPELQIEIAPNFQGCGYGYEFCLSLLKHFFESKTYEYVRYTVLPTNTASIRLVEKIGAELQPARSKIESLLMRTYHISSASMRE